MTARKGAGRGTLWANLNDADEQTLPFWRALIIALGIEIIVPFLVYGVDWSFLPSFDEPPPVEVMSVRLEEPPPALEQTPPPPKKQPEKRETPEPKPRKEIKNVTPIEPPKPLPNEVASEIEIPKPKPKPKPKPVKKEELLLLVGHARPKVLFTSEEKLDDGNGYFLNETDIANIKGRGATWITIIGIVSAGITTGTILFIKHFFVPLNEFGFIIRHCYSLWKYLSYHN